MESTSETVQWKEKSNLTSKVTKKCVQEVSATTMQNMSSSLSSLDSGKLIGSQLANTAIKISSPSAIELSQLPIENSPQSPDDENVVKNTSLQNEFIAMEIKDEHGHKIGQLMQQNEQKQSVNLSSFVSTVGSSNTSTSVTQLSSVESSSVTQQTSTASLGIKETSASSSVSSSSYISDQKQQIVSSSTRSLSSIKSSQSIEKVVKSSTTLLEEN